MGIARGAGDPVLLGRALARHAIVLRDAADLRGGDAACVEAVAVATASGDPDTLCAALCAMASADMASGKLVDPAPLYDVLDRAPLFRDRALGLVGHLHLMRGEVDQAEAAYLALRASRVARGSAFGVSRMDAHLGLLAYVRGDLELAAERTGAAAAVARAAGAPGLARNDELNTALANVRLGRCDQARALYEGVLAEARASGDRLDVLEAIAGFACLAVATGDLPSAAERLGFLDAAPDCDNDARLHAAFAWEAVRAWDGRQPALARGGARSVDEIVSGCLGGAASSASCAPDAASSSPGS